MTKRRIAAIVIDAIFIILTLAFIFGNSLLDVDKSNDASGSVTDIVEKLPPVQNAIENEEITRGEVEAILRSLAHGFEFSVLAAEIMILFLLLRLKTPVVCLILTLVIVFVLGVADECLQMLNDRSSEMVDVLKDFLGGVFGASAVFLIHYLIGTRIKRKKG